jgi:hypothetical protein
MVLQLFFCQWLAFCNTGSMVILSLDYARSFTGLSPFPTPYFPTLVNHERRLIIPLEGSGEGFLDKL